MGRSAKQLASTVSGAWDAGLGGHLRRIFAHRVPLDDEERAFLRRWLDRADESIAAANVALGLLFNALAAAVIWLLSDATSQRFLFPVHGGLTLFILAWIVGLRHTRLSIRAYVLAGQLVCALAYSYVVYRLVLPTEYRLYKEVAPSFVTALILHLLILCPYRDWRLFATAVTYLAMAMGAIFLADAERLAVSWAIVHSLCVAGSTAFRCGLTGMSRSEGLAEYRMRLQMTSRQLAQRSISDAAIEEFRPELRYCVCVSTEWLTPVAPGGAALVALGESVGRYYGVVDRLLRETVRTGHYYTDWIAGELFIVLFGLNAAEEATLADAALAFARRLLEEKAGFAKDQHLRLDVGISSGAALLGLMGPPGTRKATALGETPGKARRYHGAALALRAALGEGDRVVFGPETRARLTRDAADVRTYRAGPGLALRDLDEPELCYVARADEEGRHARSA